MTRRARPVLLAVVLSASAFGVDCDRRIVIAPDDTSGRVSLALTLSPTVTITTVTYNISGNAITPIMGSIDVSAVTRATALVTGIPASSTPYVVALAADSTDGKTHCAGSSNVTVSAGATANANVVLLCRGPNASTTGGVGINGTVDNCPVITGYSASTLLAPIGGTISIGVTATDPDKLDTLTYSWVFSPAGTPGAGMIDFPSSSMATFTCLAAGTVPMNMIVSDGV